MRCAPKKRRFSITDLRSPRNSSNRIKTMATCISSSNDMLIEILIRLPPKSVFKFRCVSKRWNYLIMDPFFVTTYNCKPRKENGGLLGFIQSGNMCFTPTSCFRHIRGRWGPTHIFLSTTAATTIGYYNGCFPPKLGYFISSSNGLILCGRHPMTYHIVNPITKHHVSLPLPPKHYPAVSVGLVCEESIGSDLVVRYKVVQACIPIDTYDTTLPIQTYSSLTGKWTESKLIAPCRFLLHSFTPPSVIRGIFHWYAIRDVIAVYEPGGENQHHLQLIEYPFDAYGHSGGLARSDDGCLWYGDSTPTNLKVWVLPKTHGYSTIAKEEWILVHIVSSYTLRKNWNPIISRRENSDAQVYHPKLFRSKKNVFFIGFAPWDPLVVILRQRQSITLYNIQTNVMESVPFRGYSYTDYYDWQPYFHSLSLSSYLL